MKVVHFESGLGNQMLDYVDYLLVKQANPTDSIYMENLIYEVKQSHDIISMWNGYELSRIFGLEVPDLREFVGEKFWNEIVDGMKKSQFWNNGWDYSNPLLQLLAERGVELKNEILRTSPHLSKPQKDFNKLLKYRFKNTEIGGALQYTINRFRSNFYLERNLYKYSNENVFCGHSLMAMFKGYGIEKVEKDIRKTFIFPDFKNRKNQDFADFLIKRNALSIHARRGDFLSVNGYCYKNGYFKRAVNYIKNNIKNPAFIFFSDSESVSWIIENLEIFGVSDKSDEIYIVDWNTGLESFRDMQLMTLCKHNIITQSSFGWWGSYLNKYPRKITIAPKPEIIATLCM